MELKLIIGCVLGWYFFSILLLFLVTKFSESITSTLEFSKLCDYLGNKFDEVTGFEDADPVIQTILGMIGLPFFPVLLVGYMIFSILRAFFQVFLKLPWRLFDAFCEKLVKVIK